MYWNLRKRQASETTAAMTVDDCVAQAHDLHQTYTNLGFFPLYWQQIDRRLDHLVAIYQFFCRLEEILIQTPPALRALLHERLKARYEGRDLPSSTGLETVVQASSEAQIKEFHTLRNLLRPAFELFVTGSLTSSRRSHYDDTTQHKAVALSRTNVPRAEPEPDNAIFFYWAEFAFLAIDAGHHTNEWLAILPVLLRAERLYVLCYGGIVNGNLPPERKFSDYQRFLDDLFVQLHPTQARLIPYPPPPLDALALEAAACARFAFPGGID